MLWCYAMGAICPTNGVMIMAFLHHEHTDKRGDQAYRCQWVD